MSKKCIYCGAELEDDALFCDECGKKQELAKETETEPNDPKDAELKAKQEADAKAKAEAAQRAKEEAEKQAQEAAEAKLEAEKQAKAEEEARKEKAAEAKRLEKERKKEERKANPTYKAYASLILGILIWITFMMGAAGLIVTLLMMVLGMVFGVQALKSTKKKIAIAGLVLNGLMVALIVVFMIS
jgi:cation transport ATPase